tara:strand:+ start:298 stop:483 length:186 start_codon:yes stop_codon:yes gene_type:complete
MRKLISILYSCAAGLEQACATFEAIQIARTSPKNDALTVGQPKKPIGFQKNIVTAFTEQKP